MKLPKLLPHAVLPAPLAEVPLALETPELPPLSSGDPVVTPEDVPLTTPAPPTKVLPETAPLVITPALLLPLTAPGLV